MGSLWDLFVAFLRSNLLGYGGGPSVIPLIEAEVVHRFQWLTAEDFGDVLAMGNALPGPIATKLAAFVGFRVGGWTGAFVALAATVGPTFLVMALGSGLLYKFRDAPIIRGMLTGVRPVVWVLFLMLAIDYVDFARSSTITMAIAVAAFVLMKFTSVNPVLAVLGGLIIGGAFIR